MNFITNRLLAFIPAFAGLRAAFKSENAIKVHCVASACVVLCIAFGDLKLQHAIALLLSCFSVIIVELINTAIEKTCDLVTNEQNTDVKFIKDVSAAAVLLVSVAALLVGWYVYTVEFGSNK